MRAPHLVAFVLCAPALAQTTWHVDASAPAPGAGTLASPYADLQFALAQSATLPGDTLLVAPGTYTGNVDFLGKDVVVKSSGGAAVTILDANLSGSVVTFASGETSAAQLDGFTLQRGRGTANGLGDVDGGGVYCVNSSPTLKNLVVTLNAARRGGGLYFANSTAHVETSAITANTGLCYTCYPMYGAGLWSSSAITVDGCTFSSNADVSEGGGAYGSGAFDNCTFSSNNAYRGGGARGVGATYNACTFDSNLASSVDADPGFGGGVYGGTLTGCTLTNNFGGLEGGGAHSATLNGCDVANNRVAATSVPFVVRGGGAYGSILADCTVRENTASSVLPGAAPGEGGGLWNCTAARCEIASNVVWSPGTPSARGGGGALAGSLVDCVVHHNQVIQSSGTDARGGGMCSGSATSTVFYANTAPIGGGVADIFMTRCTVSANTATVAGGGVAVATTSGTTTLRTSIVWGNSGAQVHVVVPALFVASYCDVQGGLSGTGNIDANPRFVDAANFDFHLRADSPCWNAGDPALPFDPDGTRADMGAFWFNRGALPAGVSICSGDGSFTDHTTPCPCGNNGAPGNGCAHSASAAGARIAATGTPSADDVVLYASNTPSGSFGIFLQHDASGDQPFHDGVLCASGSLVRLRGRSVVNGAARFPEPLAPQDATLTLSQRGGVTVGSGARRYYSFWFRNASTSFCPPATANVTNGFRVDW